MVYCSAIGDVLRTPSKSENVSHGQTQSYPSFQVSLWPRSDKISVHTCTLTFLGGGVIASRVQGCNVAHMQESDLVQFRERHSNLQLPGPEASGSDHLDLGVVLSSVGLFHCG